MITTYRLSSSHMACPLFLCALFRGLEVVLETKTFMFEMTQAISVYIRARRNTNTNIYLVIKGEKSLPSTWFNKNERQDSVMSICGWPLTSHMYDTWVERFSALHKTLLFIHFPYLVQTKKMSPLEIMPFHTVCE